MTASHLQKTSARRSAPFRLGELEVRPASGEVVGPLGTERLRPLLIDILLRLAQEPGEVVRRETLLEEVWERRMVNDEVLSRAIAELRTALGDDARAARYIETLPKIGYRLVARVSALEPMAPAASATPAMPTPARRASPWIWIGIAAMVAGTLAAVLLPRRGASNDLEARLAAARTFTSDPALEVAPRFSPDGRFVAFTLGEGAKSRIVVQSIEDSSRRIVGDGSDLRMGPVFFPDGKRIAFWRLANGECAIVEHDLASREERALVDCALTPRGRFDLSPDGRRIAFSGNSHPQSGQRLWIAEPGGGAPAPLTTPEPGQGEDAFPRFSPDGSQVAFLRGNASHARVWIVEVGGARTARPAGSAEGLGYGMAWLGPKGPLLVAADWFGFRALNVLDPATGEARLVGGRGARFPDVGPGGAIVWENAVYSSNLWLHGGAAAPKPLWQSTRYTSQAEFSPDGTQVAFASNRDGTDAVYVAPLNGEPRRIAFGDAYRYMRPHWSADGRWVHAVRIDLGPRGVKAQHGVRIPLDGGAAEELAIPAGVNDVRESRDGRWLYWGAIAGEAMQLWRAPIADPAKAERLPLPAMAHFQMNTERVVFAQPQLTRLTSCRLADLACAPLDVELGPGDLYHWALGSRSLYVRVRDGPKLAVARIDLATGQRVETLAAMPSGSGSSIAVPPDESVLLVAREEGPAVDLMLAR